MTEQHAEFAFQGCRQSLSKALRAVVILITETSSPASWPFKQGTKVVAPKRKQWTVSKKTLEISVWKTVIDFLASIVLKVLRDVMNAVNPFQVPSWVTTSQEQRRRERFKKTVMAIVIGTSLLLIGLLIQGCKNEQAAATTPVAPPDVPTALTSSQPAPVVATQAIPSNSNGTTKESTSHSITVYIVKSGDTLTRIAKTYGTSVKAIEAANGLKSDRILVGAKLKIPEA